ncbi:MAG: hypothetical protein HY904_06810 [Deltaproteobacteria bacterium]|nr:hypothetical protein [Deltaproteobacteria bacterium]
MTGALTHTLEARLAQAVPDADERVRVTRLLESCMRAIADMSRMDESLYERLAAGEGSLLAQQEAGALLLQLAAVTLDGLGELVGVLSREGYLQALPGSTTLPDDLEFDLGGGHAPEPAQLGLDELDIDGALAGLSPAQESSARRTQEVAEAARSIGYGIQSQLDGFYRRFDAAVRGGHLGQAMEDLDDTRNATGDGVFALITAVMKAYLPELSPDVVVPTHRSTLQRALLVRIGVADLCRLVERDNGIFQDAAGARADQEGALARLCHTLENYIASEAFRMMRPADRWELSKALTALNAGGPGLATRQAAEGLAKFLDSLSSINQRDALRRHDLEVLRELEQALDAARDVAGVSFSGAMSLVQQAQALAVRLYGLSRELDLLLIRWRLDPPQLNRPGDLEQVVSQLGALVRAHARS